MLHKTVRFFLSFKKFRIAWRSIFEDLGMLIFVHVLVRYLRIKIEWVIIFLTNEMQS